MKINAIRAFIIAAIIIILLFALGLFLNNGYDMSLWRIPGVLQYFAISYFTVAATVLVCYRQTAARLKNREPLVVPDTYMQWPFILQCYEREYYVQGIILIFWFLKLI